MYEDCLVFPFTGLHALFVGNKSECSIEHGQQRKGGNEPQDKGIRGGHGRGVHTIDELKQDGETDYTYDD